MLRIIAEGGNAGWMPKSVILTFGKSKDTTEISLGNESKNEGTVHLHNYIYRKITTNVKNLKIFFLKTVDCLVHKN